MFYHLELEAPLITTGSSALTVKLNEANIKKGNMISKTEIRSKYTSDNIEEISDSDDGNYFEFILECKFDSLILCPLICYMYMIPYDNKHSFQNNYCVK